MLDEGIPFIRMRLLQEGMRVKVGVVNPLPVLPFGR
jgi:hypothetical protein